MKCKVCDAKIRPRAIPRDPVRIGNVEYDLNEKRKPKGVRKVAVTCDNGHPQILRFDWDAMKYVEKKEVKK